MLQGTSPMEDGTSTDVPKTPGGNVILAFFCANRDHVSFYVNSFLHMVHLHAVLIL